MVTHEEYLREQVTNLIDKLEAERNVVTTLRAETLRLQEQVKTLRDALEDLYVLVQGESSSLLDEDRGGDAELDYKINKALRETAEDVSPKGGK